MTPAAGSILALVIVLVWQPPAAMARQGIYYVPTIYHNEYHAENADRFGFPPGSVDKFDAFIEKNIVPTSRALKAGVRVTMGSDAVYSLFGSDTRELVELVKAGMTPAQPLAAATTTGASLLGMEDRLGKIAPGYFADIVGVEGDPVAGVNAIANNVRWAMNGGAVVVDKTQAPAR